MELKTDLHLHTRERESFIAYDARELIDGAAHAGFQVLSITNHDTVTFSADLQAYAQERGILLIPGIEATIEGKHVLLYNIDVPPERIRTFADLRRLRQPDWLVVAPHPFFPGSYCLHERLIEEVDLFDAIEFSHFYTARIDFNRPAVRLAQETGLPLLGTSDSHVVRQFGTTCSLIEGSPTIASVLGAIRKGQVQVESRPLTLRACARIVLDMVVADWWDRARATLGSGAGPRAEASRLSESGPREAQHAD
jgi:hypothetical protein